MRIVEFRIILPMTVDEYQIAQLYSVAQASKNETGGGEGVEIVKNEPFTATLNPPNEPLLEGVPITGQYTQKWYHLASRMPAFLRMLAPKGSTDIREDAWNAYPYCRTIISNPGYMKDKFFVRIESMHVNDAGTSDNVHRLNAQQLAKRDIVYIDIADNSVVSKDDYKVEWDPAKYHSNKTGRGPLTGPEWQKRSNPVMCCYKLVTCQFKWFMLQGRVEHIIMKSERRLFNNFHRQLFCWIDDWFGLTIADIRRIEEETQAELERERNKGEIRGTRGDADDDKDK